MNQPPGFEDGRAVCRLNKAIYGLKQASRSWYLTMDAELQRNGFNRNSADPSLYMLKDSEYFAAIALYVDDIILTGSKKDVIIQAKGILQSCFDVKDMGEISFCLGIHVKIGIHVKRDKLLGTCHLSQERYIKMMLERFGMSDCHPVGMPMSAGEKICLAMCPKNEEGKSDMQKCPFRSLIGSLMYAAVCTRPDIAFTVMKLSQFLNNPGAGHWVAAKRVLRYLKGTMHYGPVYKVGLDALIGFADADWAGDMDERRSTSGFIFLMGGGPVSWGS